MNFYSCPHCGASLDNQYGFDSSKGYWTCSDCGLFLVDPDDSSRFDGVAWFCDGCGTYLNKQSGFSDWNDTWVCTECGYTNHISEEEIEDSGDEYHDYSSKEYNGGIAGALLKGIAHGILDALSNTEYEEENDDDDDDDENDSYYSEYINRRQEMENQKREEEARQALIEQQKKDKRKAGLKRIWSAVAHKKMIDVNISKSECIGQNYLKVVSLFEKNGFTKIHTNIVEDLEFSDRNFENLVTEVTIDGNDYFEINTQARYDASVIITVHKLRRIIPPISYKEAKRVLGPEAVLAFVNAGFVDVKENLIRDITIGWLKKDGAIERITIAGETKYKIDEYRIDTPVVVTYHTFRNKR